MKAMLFVLTLSLLLGMAEIAITAEKPSLTLDDFFRLKRISDPQLSPDGSTVAYTVGTVDLDANKIVSAIWIAAVDGKSAPRQLTNSGKRDTHPRWSPDGTKILFESNRGGTSQLWVIDVAAGGEARQVTDIATEASGGIWSPDGKRIAFVSAVYPEYSEFPFEESNAKNKERNEKAEKGPVKARIFTKLFFRHWDSYVDGKRQHLFVCDADGNNCRDVTPGDRDANPTSMTFSSSIDYTFTPDSKHIVFTAVPATGEAWTTNYDLCRVSIDNKSTAWETLTKSNEAADSGPQFSPTGRHLAYRAQTKAGYEADRWQLMIVPCQPDGRFEGQPRSLTEGLDRSVDQFAWRSGGRLVFTAEEEAESALYEVAISGKPQPQRFYFDPKMRGQIQGLAAYSTASDDAGMRVALALASMTTPAEIFVGETLIEGGPGQRLINISRANEALLSPIQRPRPESVKVPVEGGVEMQMWILKPPGFDPQKKWPVVYLVHGGPQGAWEDGWSWRWNPTLWAAQGYVIALPNPRGSTGFGQKFVDEISGDWGGKCYRDLVAGLNEVEKLPYIDKDRIAAAGASFGGYMMNWFAVNDIAPRFKTLITHCSVWNFESMWGTTEELWFDEYEHGGLPWEKPGKYREFSPHTRAGELGKHKVPMLVIHNDLDFRCPIGQGHELFTSLQRQGVPSRMVNFPDEGHWVLKPQNSKFWHEEVFTWLKKYVAPGGK